MKCYHCGINEADHRFLVNMMGHNAEVHLCGECLEGFRQYAAHMMQSAKEAAPDFMPPGLRINPALQFRELGSDNFPTDAGEEIRRRRAVSELRAKLRQAVESEDYEQAARLRDEIQKKEEGVCIYDT